jgi:hypothetical protein
MSRRRFALALAALALAALPPSRPTAAPARELWFYETLSLSDSAAVERLPAIWRRAAAAGYTRVVLTDPRFARPEAHDATYLARVRRLRGLAAELHLEIVPGVSLVGRGNGAMLTSDPDLAEALPVRDALLEVRNGIATIVADPPVALAPRPDRADAGITVTPGALRVPAGGPRAFWTVAVAPWRCYHLSVTLAGEDFSGEARINVTGGGRELAYATVASPRGAAPETRDVVFDSQGATSVLVAFGSSRSSRGVLRFSDWSLEEAGPVNLVRRPGLPFRLAGLTEGADFGPVRDPLLGMHPWKGQFDTWHDPPVIRVRRPDGTRLRASWHMAAVILRGQVACCLSDTAVIRRQVEEIARVREWFGARTVFLMHDEIRCIGQDSTCLATGRTAGQVLAANVRAVTSAFPGTRFVVWNDMFDPEHNAIDGYYLVRGSLAGAWEGLPRDAIVVNWNFDHAASSLRFFSGRGHEQVWGGYYDTPPAEIARVLPALDATPGVIGVLYATWKDRYDDLEAFAAAARGGR